MNYRIRPLWTNQPTWLDAVLSSKLRATRALECGLSVRYNRIVTSCSLIKHTTFDTKQPAYQTYLVTQLRWFGGLARDKLEQQVWYAQLQLKEHEQITFRGSPIQDMPIGPLVKVWIIFSTLPDPRTSTGRLSIAHTVLRGRHHCVTAWLRAQTYNRWSSKG
jgi:hypothetical protein